MVELELLIMVGYLGRLSTRLFDKFYSKDTRLAALLLAEAGFCMQEGLSRLVGFRPNTGLA
jgi:hypothetical protein